jgi:hypothetical protein
MARPSDFVRISEPNLRDSDWPTPTISEPYCYTVTALQPHALDPRRVLTIEGCTGRGMQPLGGQSLDEGRQVTLFPDRGGGWAAPAVVGGSGVNPRRWYASVARADSAYSRLYHSMLLRSDDDGLTWATLLESDSGGTKPDTPRPVDLVETLADNPGRSDELYAVVRHLEPRVGNYNSVDQRPASLTVRASRRTGPTAIAGNRPRPGLFHTNQWRLKPARRSQPGVQLGLPTNHRSAGLDLGARSLEL